MITSDRSEIFLSVKTEVEGRELDVLLDYINADKVRDSSYVLHEHAVHELYYIESGSMIFECAGVRRELSQGDLFMISAGTPHRVVSCGEGFVRFLVRFRFCQEQSFDVGTPLYTADGEVRSELTQLIMKIKRFDFRHPTRIEFFRLRSRLGLLFSYVFEVMSADIGGDSSQNEYDFGSCNKLILYSMIDSFLGARCHEHITLDDLARHLNYSRVQTTRIVNECCGMSFSQKLREVRIRTAKRYLVSSELSIDEIAERCGYETRSGFEAVFTRTTGQSPTSWRAENLHKK